MEAKAMKLDPEASDFDKALVNQLNRELLKYAAGKQIFCRQCKVVLDWKTTVIVDIEKGPQKHSVIVCNKCFKPEGVPVLEADGFTVEVTRKQ